MYSHETMRWVACEVLKEARVDINALSVFVREHVQNPEKYIDLISQPPDKDFDLTTAVKSLLTSIGSKTKLTDVSHVSGTAHKRHASDNISSALPAKRQSVNDKHVRLPPLKSIINFPPSLQPSPELSRGRLVQETAVSPSLPRAHHDWRHEHQSPQQHQLHQQHQPPQHHQANNQHVLISPGLPPDHHQRSHFPSHSQANSHTYHPIMTPQYNGHQTAASPALASAAHANTPDLAAVAVAATAVAASGKLYQMPTPLLSPTLQPSIDHSRGPGGTATHTPSGIISSQLSPVIEQSALHQGKRPSANAPPKLLPAPPPGAMEQSLFTPTATDTAAHLSAGRRSSPTPRQPTQPTSSPPPKPLTPTHTHFHAPVETSAPSSTQRCTASIQTHRRRRGRPRKNPEPLTPQATLPRPHRDIMPKQVPDQVMSTAAREAEMMSMGIRAGMMVSGRHVLGVRRQDATIVPPRRQRSARALSRIVGTRAGTARVASNKVDGDKLEGKGKGKAKGKGKGAR
ncbi:hypothetical protein Cpir12675_005145 [Ceratocystis pirilliformis]|uniref:Uncharacterized protein n=1 Tax=Ceratocystis pirilliformis TaxID=259994 RepID=A0ABR3YUL0_9PEZI